MRGLRARCGPVTRDQDGFTLTELLVATVLAFIVIGAAVTAFTAGIRSQPGVSSRANQIQQARAAMERITRELRQGQGWASSLSSTTELSIVTYAPECGEVTPCQVSYSCAGGTCMRSVGDGPAVQAITGLSTGDIFTYQSSNSPPVTAPTPTTNYVNVTLRYPAQGGDDAITLQDGVALRNWPIS
jgi:Tfp pilus assembly protein PilW